MPCCLNVSRVAGSPMPSAVYITKLYHRSDGACLQFIIPHLSSLPHLPGHSGLRKISHDQPIFPGAGSSGVQFLGDLAGPLAIDDTAFTLIFKAKLGALFPVVILFMLAFSNTAAKVLPSVLRSSSLNPHWVGKDWEIKQGRAPNGQVPTLANLARSFWCERGLVSSSWGLLCCSSFMFYKAKKPEAHTHTHTDTHTRGRYFESKTQYQVLHYSDYLDVVGWQKIM